MIECLLDFSWLPNLDLSCLSWNPAEDINENLENLKKNNDDLKNSFDDLRDTIKDIEVNSEERKRNQQIKSIIKIFIRGLVLICILSIIYNEWKKKKSEKDIKKLSETDSDSKTDIKTDSKNNSEK